MFDAKQLLPVVPGGDKIDIVKACLFSSPVWSRFKRHILFKNMRLESVDDPVMKQQMKDYDDMVQSIGENVSCGDILIEQEQHEQDCVSIVDFRKDFVLPCIESTNIFVVVEGQANNPFADALSWLFPLGYDAETALKNVVLATTNKLVDEWNDRIAEMNPQVEHPALVSVDKFTHVDDDKGNLQRMITSAVLDKYNSNDVPPHKLYLKVNDVCLIMRNLNVSDGVTNNTRVKILQINTRFIRCQTLGDNPIHITLPRIRFTFRLPYGRSFDLTRLQFPLRRAFAISVHKSQGQTLGRCLFDIRNGFFAHGHCYVGLSRVTHFLNVAAFCTAAQLYKRSAYCPVDEPMSWDGKPIVSNIVYKEAIQEIQALRDSYERTSGEQAGGLQRPTSAIRVNHDLGGANQVDHRWGQGDYWGLSDTDGLQESVSASRDCPDSSLRGSLQWPPTTARIDRSSTSREDRISGIQGGFQRPRSPPARDEYDWRPQTHDSSQGSNWESAESGGIQWSSTAAHADRSSSSSSSSSRSVFQRQAPAIIGDHSSSSRGGFRRPAAAARDDQDWRPRPEGDFSEGDY